MRIGILLAEQFNGPIAAELGPYEGLFARLLDGNGFSYQTYPVDQMVLPQSPDEAEGWLITGSTAGAYDDLPWIPLLEDFIRDVKGSGRPLVGICFGHQIIAQALGGRVEKATAGWFIGAEGYQMGEALLTLNAWHQDQVIAPPPDARVIARSPGCPLAGLAYGETILSFQPHPEFDRQVMEVMLTHLADGSVPKDRMDAARDRLDAPIADGTIGAQIAGHFLKNRP